MAVGRNGFLLLRGIHRSDLRYSLLLYIQLRASNSGANAVASPGDYS